MKKLLEPNLEEAKHFLSLFNFSNVTFQFLKKGKPAGYYYCNYPLTDKDWQYLAAEHSTQKEIFFMINEGDGEIHPGKSIPRSQENVTRLTSLFIDTDDCPLSEVKVFLKAQKLRPHIVVETSPKKYHLYFLLDASQSLHRDNPSFQTARKNWKHCQHILSHLGTDTPRTDSSVKDNSRVFRVPGFHHLKNPAKPHLTRIVQEYTHPHYSLDETLKLLGHHSPSLPGSVQISSHHNLYQLPDEKVGPGNRHHHLASLLGHVLNRGLSEELSTLLAYKVVEEKFEQPKKFLPGGDRNKELLDFIKYKVEDTKRAEREEIENNRKEIINTLDETDSFELPDDFYFNAPGIAGEITKEISKTAYYPLPSFAFASAVATLSLLKGKSTRLEDGTPPANYFLTLAPTGSGKNYALETTRHTLHALKKVHLVESKVRSDRGILQWLHRNDGVGLLFMDEAEELLRSMEGERTGQHIKNFKTLLLELYSSTNNPHLSFGEIASKKEDPIVLSYPHFSTVIQGTPNILESSFTRKSVTDGLFQRFNVLVSKQERISNPDSAPAHALNGNVFQSLNNLIRLTAIAAEEGPQTIKISKGAAALKQEAISHYNALYNEELRQDTQLEGIYSRAVEKAMRLATALTDSDTLQPKTLEYTLSFIKNNTEATRQLAYESFAQSDVSKDMKDLQRFVAKNSKKGPCTYRSIVRKFRVRDSRTLKIILQDCIDCELLNPHKVEASTKGGRPGMAYSIAKIG